MASIDEDAAFGAPKPKISTPVIGGDIDQLSAPELAERIEICRKEIVRLEAAIVAREATRQAASAFFKT